MYLEGIEIEHWLEWENFVKSAGNVSTLLQLTIFCHYMLHEDIL